MVGDTHGGRLVDTVATPQRKDEQEFKVWWDSLVWSDPYPNYQELARLAWLAARNPDKPNQI